MKVGILTGGGDCPGLNAVIRAVVRKGCFHYEDEFVGFLEGWRGLVEDKSMPLDLSSVGEFFPAAACGDQRPCPVSQALLPAIDELDRRRVDVIGVQALRKCWPPSTTRSSAPEQLTNRLISSSALATEYTGSAVPCIHRTGHRTLSSRACRPSRSRRLIDADPEPLAPRVAGVVLLVVSRARTRAPRAARPRPGPP